jgi:hypothetical protein
MFVEDLDLDIEVFPEDEFDALVKAGRLRKSVTLESVRLPGGQTRKVRRVLYALPDEEWRIKALLLVLETYEASGPGWKPDLERVIGTLLGYERQDIEEFIKSIQIVSPPS